MDSFAIEKKKVQKKKKIGDNDFIALGNFFGCLCVCLFSFCMGFDFTTTESQSIIQYNQVVRQDECSDKNQEVVQLLCNWINHIFVQFCFRYGVVLILECSSYKIICNPL